MKAKHTDGISAGLPTRYIEAFLERLRAARYSEVTLCNKRRVLSAFSRWMMSKNVSVAEIDESTVASFLTRLSGPPAARVQFEFAAMRLFLALLRDQGIV